MLNIKYISLYERRNKEGVTKTTLLFGVEYESLVEIALTIDMTCV